MIARLRANAFSVVIQSSQNLHHFWRQVSGQFKYRLEFLPNRSSHNMKQFFRHFRWLRHHKKFFSNGANQIANLQRRNAHDKIDYSCAKVLPGHATVQNYANRGQQTCWHHNKYLELTKCEKRTGCPAKNDNACKHCVPPFRRTTLGTPPKFTKPSSQTCQNEDHSLVMHIRALANNESKTPENSVGSERQIGDIPTVPCSRLMPAPAGRSENRKGDRR